MESEQTSQPSSLGDVVGYPPTAVFDDGAGRIEYWRVCDRVSLFAAHGSVKAEAVSWATDRMSALLEQNAPRRIYVVWDLSRQRHHETDARRRSASWFMKHRRSVIRFVLFTPERPFIRMAATVALAAVGASEHVYSRYDRFLAVVRETVDYVRTHG